MDAHDSKIPLSTAAPAAQKTYRVYRRRWLMLSIIMLFGIFSTAQWVQYSIISDLVMRYYNVSSYAVDWTSILFMAIYVPFCFPVAFYIDKLGLRKTMIIGVAVMELGSVLKCGSASPGRFALTLAGQTLVGVSQLFLLSVPPNLAAIWFGADQVSTATSLGILGLQLGVAVSFVMPPLMVRNHDNVEDIGTDLARMFYIVAGFCTGLLALTVFLFQDKPPQPPSAAAEAAEAEAAAAEAREGAWVRFKTTVKRMLRDKSFLLLMVTYGINLAAFNAFSTLLNQLVLMFFKDEGFAGQLGLLFVVIGMLGSVACGIFLDRTHKFKELTVGMYGVSGVLLMAFALALRLGSKALIYVTAATFGAAMGGYMTVSFEFGVELMYPESESTMAAMLLLSSQIQSVPATVGYAWLLNETGDLIANGALAAFLAIGTVLSAMIRSDLRRQAALAAATSPAKHSPLPATDITPGVPEAEKLVAAA